MRLLVISERYPPHITGGYEIACASVVEGLRARGHEVEVLTSDFGLTRSPARDDRGVLRQLHYKQNAKTLLQLARWEFSDHKVLRNVLASWRPELISVWSMLHLFPSLHHRVRAAGVPVVYNIHDAWLHRHLGEAEWLRGLWHRAGATWPRRVGKSLIRRAIKLLHPEWLRPVAVGDVALEHVVFCSRYQQDRYREAGLPEHHTRVIYNGIDTVQFDGDPGRAEPGVMRLLFVGRLVPEKGAHTAVAAIEELRRRGHAGVSLSIAGVAVHPWEYAEGLKARSESGALSGAVRWLGAVPNDALPDVYRAHDVLVFPSSHLEGLPMTLLEAMGCGLAVVGSASGGNAELLADGVNSLIVPPGDPVGLADALERLVRDVGWVRALADRARRHIREKFAIDAAVDLTEQFLAEMTEGRRMTRDAPAGRPVALGGRDEGEFRPETR